MNVVIHPFSYSACPPPIPLIITCFHMIFPNIPYWTASPSFTPPALMLNITHLHAVFLISFTSFFQSAPCLAGFHSSPRRGRGRNNNYVISLHEEMLKEAGSEQTLHTHTAACFTLVLRAHPHTNQNEKGVFQQETPGDFSSSEVFKIKSEQKLFKMEIDFWCFFFFKQQIATYEVPPGT